MYRVHSGIPKFQDAKIENPESSFYRFLKHTLDPFVCHIGMQYIHTVKWLYTNIVYYGIKSATNLIL